MRILTHTASRDGGIKDILRYEMALSATLIKRVKYGGVAVNGQTVHMRAHVCAGDTVTVRLPEETAGHVKPRDIPLSVLFEDADVLAVCKPSCMPTHPSRGNALPTLAEAVCAYAQGAYPPRAIGRLDRDTSGVVLFAKHALAAYRLGDAIKKGQIEKTYVALVDGVPQPPQGTVDAPIARMHEGAILRGVCPHGKPSQTVYRVIRTDGTRSLVELHPLTGRTHQIRVHMAHIGHPLCNDPLYGIPHAQRTFCLHAACLRFPHPMDGRYVSVDAPAPFTL